MTTFSTPCLAFAVVLLAGFAGGRSVQAAGDARISASAEFFERNVRTVLEKHCVGCHGPEKRKGKLTLHDIGRDFGDDASVQLWERVLEQLEIHEMPPADEPQPGAGSREQVIAWIKDGLTAAGRGYEMNSKLLLPEYGNRVSHELLFNGQITELPYSPSRLWRISPEIYKGRKLQPNVAGGLEAVPLGYSTKNSGIRDFASQEIVGEAEFLSLMTAFEDMITSQLHDRTVLKGKAGKTTEVVSGKATFKAITEASGPPARAAMEAVVTEEFFRTMGRAILPDELKRFTGFMAANIQHAGKDSGLKLGVMAIYLSPEAIYRMELGLGVPDEHGRRMLSPQELAYALSYAISDLPPMQNKVIREALENGKLSTRQDIEKVVRQMIAEDKKGKDGNRRARRFFDQFFEHPKLDGVFKDGARMRGVTGNRATLGSVQKNIAAILQEDRNVVAELLASKRFNMDGGELLKELAEEHAAKLKTLPPEKHAAEERDYEKKLKERAKKLVTEDYRAGILTDPSWLRAFSKCTENDPVHRGKWIQERLLAGSIPAVPIGVDAQIPDNHDKTLRERYAKTEQAECWKCHKLMNPLGMAFESFDDLGRFRTGLHFDTARKVFIDEQPDQIKNLAKAGKLETRPVDATGELRGSGDPALDGPVKDALDLVQRLGKSPRVRQSIIRHAFRFYMGRNEMLSDSKTLIAAERAYVGSGGSFKEVIISFLTSDSFLYRK